MFLHWYNLFFLSFLRWHPLPSSIQAASFFKLIASLEECTRWERETKSAFLFLVHKLWYLGETSQVKVRLPSPKSPKEKYTPKPILKMERDWRNEQRSWDEKKMAGLERANPARNDGCLRAGPLWEVLSSAQGLPEIGVCILPCRDSASCLSH